MASSPSSKLYSPRLLALSVQLADFPLAGEFDFSAEARSRTCGSTIALGISTTPDGTISRLGLRVSACAVGQSSAAVMAKSAMGKSANDLDVIYPQINAWLAGKAALPPWPDFDALETALPHPGRHEAILLPWRAAVEALSSGDASG